MNTTPARRSRLFTVREDHFLVDESPQIVLPRIKRSAAVPLQPEVEDEDDEEDPTEDEDPPESVGALRIFLSNQGPGEAQLQDAYEDVEDVFLIGAGLPDEDTMDTEADDEISAIRAAPPPLNMPTFMSFSASASIVREAPAAVPVSEPERGWSAARTVILAATAAAVLVVVAIFWG